MKCACTICFNTESLKRRYYHHCHETSFQFLQVIANCMLFLILSSALPLLVRTLGTITVLANIQLLCIQQVQGLFQEVEALLPPPLG